MERQAAGSKQGMKPLENMGEMTDKNSLELKIETH